jgi:hypothetical protein
MGKVQRIKDEKGRVLEVRILLDDGRVAIGPTVKEAKASAAMADRALRAAADALEKA